MYIDSSASMELVLKNRQKQEIARGLVSEEDYQNVKQYGWYISCGYIQGRVNGKIMSLHHFIMGKPVKGLIVDHINQNRLDNRRENLRFATLKLNAHNRKKNLCETSTTQYKGIRHKKNRQSYSWTAQYGGKHIGAFDNEIDAAKAYDAYVYQLYGEEAIMNFEYSSEEKEDMKIRKLGKDKRELPTGVSYDKRRDQYEIKFQCKFLGYAKDIEEGQKIYKIAKEAYEKDCLEKRLALPITYNNDGIAVIYMKNKKNNELKEILVDEEDWHGLMQSSWSNNTGYAIGTIDGKPLKMHRYIMKTIDSKTFIDHINGNRLDNRKENLREVTAAENGINKKPRNDENATSKYNGVHRRSANRFGAIVTKDGINYRLGSFIDEKDAARAYNEKAKELFGEFANLNIIED
jgi:hypothetical protein